VYREDSSACRTTVSVSMDRAVIQTYSFTVSGDVDVSTITAGMNWFVPMVPKFAPSPVATLIPVAVAEPIADDPACTVEMTLFRNSGRELVTGQILPDRLPLPPLQAAQWGGWSAAFQRRPAITTP